MEGAGTHQRTLASIIHVVGVVGIDPGGGWEDGHWPVAECIVGRPRWSQGTHGWGAIDGISMMSSSTTASAR